MAELLSLDPTDPTPLHAQLECGIRAAIATGRVSAGGQLPTVRQLAVDLRVNANTVAKVYAHLERQGLLETRRGVGTFVTQRPGPAIDGVARASELRRVTDRFLADLGARGFSLDEALAEIEAQRSKGA